MFELLFKNSKRVVYIESTIDHADAPFVPIFFYHVPRTGGLFFYNSLRTAMKKAYGYSQLIGNVAIEPLTCRIDENDINSDYYRHSYALIASHNTFGFHRRFIGKFFLATIVRDPIQRVISEFTYYCMRDGRQPEVTAFKSFMRGEENINRTVKQLAGQRHFDQPAPENAAERAIANLQRHFDAFITSDYISVLTARLLSQYKLPNILSDRVNTTRPQFLFDASPSLDELAALNSEDLKLFRFVTASPRLPPQEGAQRLPHPLTVLIHETEETKYSDAISAIMETVYVMNMIRSSPDLADNLSFFFRQ